MKLSKLISIISIIALFLSLIGTYLSPWYSMGVGFSSVILVVALYCEKYLRDDLSIIDKRISRIEAKLNLPEIEKMMKIVTGKGLPKKS